MSEIIIAPNDINQYQSTQQRIQNEADLVMIFQSTDDEMPNSILEILEYKRRMRKARAKS